MSCWEKALFLALKKNYSEKNPNFTLLYGCQGVNEAKASNSKSINPIEDIFKSDI